MKMFTEDEVNKIANDQFNRGLRAGSEALINYIGFCFNNYTLKMNMAGSMRFIHDILEFRNYCISNKDLCGFINNTERESFDGYINKYNCYTRKSKEECLKDLKLID